MPCSIAHYYVPSEESHAFQPATPLIWDDMGFCLMLSVAADGVTADPGYPHAMEVST